MPVSIDTHHTESLPPLALYLHFPWCVSKCPYCDFNSFARQGDTIPEQRYLSALRTDLDAQAPAVAGREVVSIFLGGGTPSLFSPQGIGAILDHARRTLAVAADAEITLEANPGTVEHARFAEYRAAGINRVSLGAQSFDAAQLKQLGRIHGPDDTRRAAEELHAAGLSNFNLDLMYGLPAQSATGALTDMQSALALDPAHLSHYHLTIEPGTAFAATPPVLPADDNIDAMLDLCLEELTSRGFAQYEVSGYARPGRECRHNLNYWCFGDYLGVGAGAHGKLSRNPQGALEIWRTTLLREPRRYLAAPGALTTRAVLPADRPFEFLMNALRLRQGFAAGAYETRTGLVLSDIEPQLAAATARGWLEQPAAERWRCTPLGLRFLNDVLQLFLPDSNSRAATST